MQGGMGIKVRFFDGPRGHFEQGECAGEAVEGGVCGTGAAEQRDGGDRGGSSVGRGASEWDGAKDRLCERGAGGSNDRSAWCGGAAADGGRVWKCGGDSGSAGGCCFDCASGVWVGGCAGWSGCGGVAGSGECGDAGAVGGGFWGYGGFDDAGDGECLEPEGSSG